jgi:hypothetical protein
MFPGRGQCSGPPRGAASDSTAGPAEKIGMANLIKNQEFRKEQRQKRNYLIHLLYVRQVTLESVAAVAVCASEVFLKHFYGCGRILMIALKS